MIQRSLVEFDLDVVTAQFDNPSGIPVFPALDAGGLYVLTGRGPVRPLDNVGRVKRG
jgi:hypothetical protein